MVLKCNRRYMKDLFKKCNGDIILKRFDTKDMIKEVKWIYAVQYCSKCEIVINLLKKSELNKEELNSLK